jgi:hypothetical protein
VGAKIPRTEHGLLDWATLGDPWYRGEQPRPYVELVDTTDSYALLAPGGAGKTTLLSELARREPASTTIDLRLHNPQSLAATLDQLIADRSKSSATPQPTVFIDALDAALLVNPDIAHVLVTLLSRPAMNTLVWRFACRPSSWTPELDGLRASLPNFEALELLPFGIPELRVMAASDADHFLTEVEHAGLLRLLALPLHALDLLEEWRESGGLPANRSSAMQHAVNRMLTEASTTRPLGQLDDQRRRLVAERLATLATFCSAGSYSLTQARPAGDIDAAPLPVSSVPTHAEPDLDGAPLTVASVREVLGTALFSPAARGAVTFIHQSYAEFLSAAYLKRRGVSGQRLVALLGADVNGLIPGPMIEVLGWLLATGAPVPDDLISDNAKQLLSTAGLELAEDHVRASVVQALLSGAAAGTIEGVSRADTSMLAHPGLAAQLHEAYESASGPWVMFWICRLARQCAVHQVADDLALIALEPSWPDFLRAEAITAFATGAPHRIPELAPLLHLDQTHDARDEILAAALRAFLTGADFSLIRGAIRPKRDSSYIGSYDRLLGELPTLTPASDVLATLTHALRCLPEHRERAFDDLVHGLLRRAWDTRDPATVEAIGAALASDRFGRRTELPWYVDDDPDLRRTMAAAAIGAHEHAFAAVLDLGMLTPSDLSWLIDWTCTAPPEALPQAFEVLRHLAWNVADADTADRILSLDENHPAYPELKSFTGERAIASRPRWLRYGDPKSDEAAAQQVPQLRAAIENAHAAVDEWWQIFAALAGNRAQSDRLLDWDLTRKPLWLNLSQDEQDRLLLDGINYLNTRTPVIGRWVARTEFQSDDVLPDWAGAYLIATLAVHHPQLLIKLNQTTWAAWAPVITAMTHYSTDQSWLKEFRAATPQRAHDAIDTALRQQIAAIPEISFAHHPLAEFSDPRLLNIVEKIAADSSESATRRQEAIDVLIAHDPDRAAGIARAAMNDAHTPAAAYTALAKLAPAELIADWITHKQLGPLDHLRGLDPDRLSDDSLTRLTGLLLDQIPFAHTPDQVTDFSEATPLAVGRRSRTALLQSMAARGMTAALTKLECNRPQADAERIRQLRQEARIREARNSWRPLRPATLMDLLASGDARLIRDSGGLLTVLLEQLEQIQIDLRRGGFRSLWNGEPGADNASPKSEDTVSDWLVHELELRLKPHVVLDREIQVTRRKDAGVGTRIDITATAGGTQIARVSFEAKLVNNPELLTALTDQLVNKYMEPAGLTHGVYIVYWTVPKLRPSSWRQDHPDDAALGRELVEQAHRHRPLKYVDIVILDIGPSDR